MNEVHGAESRLTPAQIRIAEVIALAIAARWRTIQGEGEPDRSPPDGQPASPVPRSEGTESGDSRSVQR